MKKIFAIALALVMVLSMASAFAMNCLTIDWSTSTNCGTGKVEVLPYVLGNKAGGGNTYVQNDCAAAVNNQKIYYAVKVTVDEKPNAEWWDKATLAVTHSAGLSTTSFKMLNDDGAYDLNKALVAAGNDTTTLEAGVYYIANDGKSASTTFNSNTHLFTADVLDVNEGIEVCAKLESSAKVKVGSSAADAIEINGAKVFIGIGTGFYEIHVDDVVFRFENAGKFLCAVVGGRTYTNFCDGKYFGDGGEYAEAACNNKDDYKAITDAMAAINITWGQKISLATAQDKLQWSGKVSDCAKWNDEAYSIVNAECQVQVMSIPKTGDVSVVAYAVMAVVAAAGAMLKK